MGFPHDGKLAEGRRRPPSVAADPGSAGCYHPAMDYGLAGNLSHLANNSPGSCASVSRDVLRRCPSGAALYHIPAYPNLHYHVRLTNGWIVDATWTQFFAGLSASVFAGPPHELVELLRSTMASGAPLAKHVFFVKDGDAQDMFDKIWGAAAPA
jgi:hypothetical protein